MAGSVGSCCPRSLLTIVRNTDYNPWTPLEFCRGHRKTAEQSRLPEHASYTIVFTHLNTLLITYEDLLNTRALP